MRLSSALLLLVAAAAFAQSQRPVDEFSTSAGPVRITVVHHASMMIEGGGRVIHVDPWSQGNYDGLPKADLILITDIHGDHMDEPMIRKLSKPNTIIIGPYKVYEAINNVRTVRNNESIIWEDWRIQAVPMYNLKRGPAPGKFYHDKGRGNGYVLHYGGKRFYIAGDTEGIPEMKALTKIDVAFIPMNLPYTMTPEEAAEAVRAFHPAVVYPYHYRGSDPAAFQKALEGSGIEVRIRNWYY